MNALNQYSRNALQVETLENRDVPSTSDLLGGVIVTYPADHEAIQAGELATPGSTSLGTAGTPIRTLPRDRFVVASGAGNVTTVNIYDATTNSLLGTLNPFGLNDRSGATAAVADITGDGIQDIIIGKGAGSTPTVKVFDGATFKEVRSFLAYSSTFTGGVTVAAGDVNGDGRADIVTAAGFGGGPHVQVFYGDRVMVNVQPTADRSFFAYDPNFRGGVNLAVADIDGDHHADIVTGAGIGGGPHVEIFSGANHNLIASYFAFNPAFTGGVSVAAGDLYGDGRKEVIVTPQSGAAQLVRVLDVDKVVSEFLASSESETRGASVAIRDLTADGKGEILIGSGRGAAPSVKVLNASGKQLRAFPSMMPSYAGGLFAA